MRKVMRLVILFAVCSIIIGVAATEAQAECTKIKDGTLVAANGAPLENGYDVWGYNYQARQFNGFYENVSRPVVPRITGDTHLVMKWSQDWMSNMDCDDNGKLDRGYDSKTGPSSDNISRGWTTNHMEGSYLGSDGNMHHWTYFAKIAWVGPAPTGTDPWAGARIWGQYAVIQEMQNDPFGEYGGNLRAKIKAPGLGRY